MPLQIMAWPTAAAVPHWQHEIDGWWEQVERRLRRSPKLPADIEAERARPPMPLPVHTRRADCGASGMSDRLALSNPGNGPEEIELPIERRPL